MENLEVEQMDPNQNPYELKWIKIPGKCLTFRLSDEPELIHIIKTGFEDRYLLVWEDAYELMLGKVEILSKKEMEERFQIDISELNG
jgi:hypothetical protein